MTTDELTMGGTMGVGDKVAAKATSFPQQIKYIVGNEACERFSFYGMRSILVVFMTQHLLMAKQDATASFHLFVSACYFLPLVGAYLSDRFWGKYKTIMLLSSVYCLGHATLALWENKMGLFAGLALVAIGTGGIKPCVSAHVGDQFTSKNKHLVKSVFDLFYFSVNFGSFFSTLLIPVLLAKYGPQVAFGVPGILMFLATVVFWMGRTFYVHVPPTGKVTSGFTHVLWYALTHRSQRKAGEHFLDVAKARYPERLVEGSKAAFNIFKVFIMVSGFWALFDQHSSSWVLQAKQMDLGFLGMQLEASQIAALNPIMVMLLIPLFAYVIYPLSAKFGYEPTPLRRMSAGMLVTGASFVIVAVYQALIDRGVILSVGWHIIPFLVLTAAEVMVSITGLEFAYTQAPREMKSTIMSFWLLTVFFGNMFTASIAELNVFKGSTYFLFFAGLVFGFALLFIRGARGYKMVDRMADVD